MKNQLKSAVRFFLNLKKYFGGIMSLRKIITRKLCYGQNEIKEISAN